MYIHVFIYKYMYFTLIYKCEDIIIWLDAVWRCTIRKTWIFTVWETEKCNSRDVGVGGYCVVARSKLPQSILSRISFVSCLLLLPHFFLRLDRTVSFALAILQSVSLSLTVQCTRRTCIILFYRQFISWRTLLDIYTLIGWPLCFLWGRDHGECNVEVRERIFHTINVTCYYYSICQRCCGKNKSQK